MSSKFGKSKVQTPLVVDGEQAPIDATRTTITEASQIASILAEACDSNTEALFCGADYAIEAKVALKNANSRSVELEFGAEQGKVVPGAICTLTFPHRGVRVVCTSIVTRSTHSKNRTRLLVQTPRFLAIRELRSQSRVSLANFDGIETMVTSFGKISSMQLVDLSTEGARLELTPTQRSVLKVGDSLVLAIVWNQQSVQASAQIRWIRETQCGVSFLESTWAQRLAISKLVRGLTARLAA